MKIINDIMKAFERIGRTISNNPRELLKMVGLCYAAIAVVIIVLAWVVSVVSLMATDPIVGMLCLCMPGVVFAMSL